MSILSLKIPTAFLGLLMWLACITSGGITAAEEPMNYVLTTDNTPLCTPDELAEWQETVYNSQGVAGRDPVGYNIGSIPAKTQTLVKEVFTDAGELNWYPIDGLKHTLSGKLSHFGIYEGSHFLGTGGEVDWNNDIIPDENYSFIITDVLPRADLDEIHKCDGLYCLEAEITPDQSFFSNPWFDKNSEHSSLVGRTICTYGPWVYEKAHGSRPEIHPSELYWWSGRQGPNAVGFMMMLLQDDSNRFDRQNNFADVNPPYDWHPWSEFPRTGEFKIAFLIDPDKEILSFDVNIPTSNNVVTSEDPVASLDSDDGKDHAIEYNGKVIVRAMERQSNDDDLGVQFTDVCRRDDGKLQGYLTITGKIGRGDRGDEGFLVLSASSRSGRARPPLRVDFQNIRIENASGLDFSPDVTFEFTVNDETRVTTQRALPGIDIDLSSFNPVFDVDPSTNPGPLYIRVRALWPGASAPRVVNDEVVEGSGIARLTKSYDYPDFGQGTHTEIGSDNSETGDDTGYSFETTYTIEAPIPSSSGPIPFISGLFIGSTPGSTPIRIREVPQSLRREIVDGHPQLVGDIQILSADPIQGEDSPLMVEFLDQTPGAEFEPNQQIAISREISPGGQNMSQEGFFEDSEVMLGTIRNVPILIGGGISVRNESVILSSVDLPKISLAPYVASQLPQIIESDSSAWAAMAQAAGGDPSKAIQPAQMVRINQWQIGVSPGYAPVHESEGEVSPEDDSVFAGELSAVFIDNNTLKARDLFGSDQPVRVEWSFEAKNLISGAELPVRVVRPSIQTPGTEGLPEAVDLAYVIEAPAQLAPSVYSQSSAAEISNETTAVAYSAAAPASVAQTDLSLYSPAEGIQDGSNAAISAPTSEVSGPLPPGEIRVEVLPTSGSRSSIRVTFPEQSDNAVYELTATAKMTDSFGTTGSIKHRLYSHALSTASEANLIEVLIPAVADLSGIPASEFQEASRIDNLTYDYKTVNDPLYRHARMLRLLAIYAAEDDLITVDELQSMIGVAKLSGAYASGQTEVPPESATFSATAGYTVPAQISG